ncbi:MAG: twitch domain-containing radical SAM protein [Pseudomonadota bacterium]
MPFPVGTHPLSHPENSSICPFPWIHQMIDTSGDIRLCCHAERSEELGDCVDAAASWNGPALREIRRQMANGEAVPACGRCYAKEIDGVESARQQALRVWGEHPAFQAAFQHSLEHDFQVENRPIYMDIRFGNRCNLVCKMCWGASSSQIVKDHKRLQAADPERFRRFFGPLLDVTYDWYEAPEAWAFLEDCIPFLEELYLTGGEPTLIEQNLAFLKRCVATGHADHIRLRFNTNLTTINDEFLDVVSRFKWVHFGCSIDGAGPVYEYIRYPARWDRVRGNYLRLLNAASDHPFSIGVAVTVQLLNVLHLPVMLDDFAKIHDAYRHLGNRIAPMALSLLSRPPRYAVRNAPEPVKREAQQRLERWMQANQQRMGAYDRRRQPFEEILALLGQSADDPESGTALLAFHAFQDSNKRAKLETHVPELHALLRQAEPARP